MKPSTADIAGRVIIVTGGAGGIGSATARLLAAHGARIALTDISPAGAQVAEQIVADGGHATFVRADIALEAEVARVVEETVRIYGRLDGAFNNAGVQQCAVPLHELSADHWNRCLGINLSSIFLCMKYQIRAMLDGGSGAIVNTASALGKVAIPDAAEYVAARHGVVGLTKAAACDYAAKGIRVNAVLPGIVRTPMLECVLADPVAADHFKHIQARHLLGRYAEPTEIGEAVRWLLSDSASFVTGATISVDGGYLAN